MRNPKTNYWTELVLPAVGDNGKACQEYAAQTLRANDEGCGPWEADRVVENA